MTKKQLAFYREAAEDGIIPDSENPIFLLSGVPSPLLVKIVRGEFDLPFMARLELENRDLNHKGQYVGFSPSPKKENTALTTPKKKPSIRRRT